MDYTYFMLNLGQRGTFCAGVFAATFLIAVCGYGQTLPESDGDHQNMSIELLLQVDQNQSDLKIIRQRLVPKAAPQNRHEISRYDKMAIQSVDEEGQVLSTLPINDPSILHAEWLAETDPENPGLLTGQQMVLPVSSFLVYLPYNEHTHHVVLSKIVEDSSGRIGMNPLSQAMVNRGMFDEYSDGQLPVIGQTWDSTIVVDNGDPANRLNIVFVGDGYTADQMDDYAEDVQAVVDHFFSELPLNEYQYFFNVARVNVISNESGSDHPNQGHYVDTALDSYYNCNNITRLICLNTQKAFMAAADAPFAFTPGLVIAVVNDEQYGGSGGEIAVASVHELSADIALHEIGHSFGGLADEYYYDSTVYYGNEPPFPNVTIETQRDQIKWHRWIYSSTQIPTTDETPGVVGLYEGGYYYQIGIFRPTFNSKMNSLLKPFEQVNSEALIKRIYNRISMIEDSSPEGVDIQIPESEPCVFSVDVMDPNNNYIQVKWFLNDHWLSTDDFFVYNSQTAPGATDILRAVIYDNSRFLKYDSGGYPVDSRTWRIQTYDTGKHRVKGPLPDEQDR